MLLTPWVMLVTAESDALQPAWIRDQGTTRDGHGRECVSNRQTRRRREVSKPLRALKLTWRSDRR